MRTPLLATLGAALLLTAAPAWARDDSRVVTADCQASPYTGNEVSGSWSYTDLNVYAAVDSPSAVPVAATLACYFVVDGVSYRDAGVTGSGAGVVVAHGNASALIGSDAVDVLLCVTVDFTGPGDDTPTYERCVRDSTRPLVPEVGR